MWDDRERAADIVFQSQLSSPGDDNARTTSDLFPVDYLTAELRAAPAISFQPIRIFINSHHILKMKKKHKKTNKKKNRTVQVLEK